MTPLYIFDIDGTLTNAEHRVPYLADSKDIYRWDKFNSACALDTAHTQTIATLELLKRAGADILFFTGRYETYRETTINWLVKHTSYIPDDFDSDTYIELLTMRPVNCRIQDSILKEIWLNKLSSYDRARLAAVFEDRASVVEMWRRNKVRCFQVAKGDF